MAVQGSWRKGYVRLDDSVSPRLELRWEAKRKDPRLEDVVRAYEHQFRRQKGFPVDPCGDGFPFPGALAWRCFTWEGRQFVHDVAAAAPASRRAIMLRLYSPSQKKGRDWLRGIASAFLPAPDGASSLWTAYGLSCRVPLEYELRKADLRTGFLRLQFGSGHRTLDFQRLRLADSLGDEPLRAAEKRWGVGPQEFRAVISVHGHEAKRYEGVHAEARRRVLPSGRLHASIWLWHCPQTNSLLSVRAEGRKDEAPPHWEVSCHG